MVTLDPIAVRSAEPAIDLARATTLVELYQRTRDLHPEAPALVLDGQTVSYRRLDALADEIALRLRKAGAGPGERVGLRIPSGTLDLYAGVLGILKSGAAYVPVDADDPDERARQVFAGADVVAILGAGLEVIPRRPAHARRRRPTPADDAWVIFTSGTTGVPKGVAVTHASATAFVTAEQRLWCVTPQDRVLAGLSVAFDASCEEIWTAWANGAALVPAPRSVVRSGVDLGAWMAERGVTVVSTVPTLATLWPDDVLAGIRLLILGGEALPEPLGHRLAASCEVWNTYGPTEATVVSTAARVVPGRPITIGFPLHGWKVAVVDEEGRPVELGEPGELVIGGVGLGRYLDPAMDLVRYAPLPALGWARAYRSGDVVRATPDGFAFVGRSDDQVKIGGRRLELGEVEAHLASFPGIAAAAVVVRETASGNKLLAGYVVAAAGADLDPAAMRDHVAERLSGGLAPLVIVLDAMPLKSSGKVDKKALPWPPPGEAEGVGTATDGRLGWLIGCWQEQLGPLPLTAESDFFAHGGTSVAAAKLVSALRERYPSAAVADVYHHPTLGGLAARLDELGESVGEARTAGELRNGGWRVSALAHLLGLGIVLGLGAVPWVLALLAYDDLFGARVDLRASWFALIPIWVVLGSLPGRAAIVALLRRTLLGGLRDGRYPRHSWIGWRLWFVETLATAFHLDHLAGTPWAGRIARLSGFAVARDARLGTLPPPSGLIRIGAGATIEKEVELRGWYVEGTEVVVAGIEIGAGARIAQRTMINPGVTIGAGAETEVGSVICHDVPAGERWAGSPAVRVGSAGDLWQDAPAPVALGGGRGAFALALAIRQAVPLLALLPGLIWIVLVGGGAVGGITETILLTAPLLGISWFGARCLLTALVVRLAARRYDAGWIRDESPAAAALWLSDALMSDAMTSLFPLFATSFTRAWLRLCGIEVGRGTEVSTSTGISHLIRYGASSFSTDDVCFVTGRSRDGWTELGRIRIGDRSFLGNGAIIRGGTTIGDDCLIGLQTLAPYDVPDGTTWLGTPALEVPRIRVVADPHRTLTPSRRLQAQRRAFDVARILLPVIMTAYLATGFDGLLALDSHHGVGRLILVAPAISLVLGLAACAFTIAAKWLLIGRYRPTSHPFFSTFVWRDEMLNSCQEMLAGTWLLRSATGTSLLNGYLRLMGARIGRDAYIDTLAITEYDQVDVAESAAVNHHACIQTHLFHDRVMQIGPSRLGAGSTMGPRTAVLPDTVVGDDTHLGMRSVLLRGEALPAVGRWVGIPLVAAPALRADLQAG